MAVSNYYLICFLVACVLSILYIYKWNANYDGHITLIFMIIPFTNYGFWEMSVAHNVEQAILANKITYLGGCYTPLMVMLSILTLCKIRVGKTIQTILYAITTALFVLTLTIGYNNWYYKSVTMEVVNGVTILNKVYSPAHTLFYIMLIEYLGIGVVALLYALVKKSEISKVMIGLLLLSNFFVMFTFFAGKIFHGIEFLPLGYDISLMLLLIISDRLVLYNVDQTVMQTMLARGDIGVVSFDLKHRFLGCNDVAKKYYPPLDKLRVDKKVDHTDPELDQLREWMYELRINRTLDLYYEQGENYYKVSAKYLYDGSNVRGFHFIFTDCTDERNYQKLLKTQADTALAASEAKGRFLAHMSHEIRTPINSVLGLDTMILRESTEPKIREYAVDIGNAGQALLALINDILDFSKIESGKMEIVLAEYGFSSLIHDVISMISMKADAKGLKINLELDEHLPCGLYGDDVRIRQVLVNIMSNAVKYTEKGSITFSISGEVVGNQVLLHFAVKDTGIGIRKEDIKKLFDPFERIDEKRNRNIEGTGLGMSITIQLLRLMGSELKVESVYGEGSTFSFDLYQEIRNFEAIGNLQNRVAEQSSGYEYEVSYVAPEARVLVVDDNPMNRRVFASLLKDTQIQIDEAEGGLEALVLIEKQPYDIIFLDHMMPDPDGMEVRKRMLAMEDYPNKNTPVIALTANAITGAKEMYLAAGFDAYLSKPINPDNLEKLVGQLLPEEKKQAGEVKAKTQQTNQAAEELPMVEGVDWDYALFKLKETELVMSVIKDFSLLSASDLQELSVYYEQLKKAFDDVEKEQSFGQYRVKVHAMKTSAAMFGASSVSALAKVLEYAARDCDMDTIDAVHPIFSRDWTKLKTLIDEAFGFVEESDEGKPQLDIVMLKQYLGILAGAMEILDTDTADEIMEELQKYSYDKESKERLNNLAIAVRILDIDKSLEIIKAWD
ncbi:MAG: ATP-binding protein [bacterium]|nr:ATP-binding protein [bacterium]